MKKVILTGTVLFAFAAASYAQVTSYAPPLVLPGHWFVDPPKFIVPVSTANRSVISQINGAQYNQAGATQTGQANISTITQDASGGASLRGSSGAVGVGTGKGNFAGTLQTGNGNTATIGQSGASVSSNFGEIYQYGKNNEGTITQGATATDNAVTIMQGSVTTNDGNKATVSQNAGTSTRNTATIMQDGKNGTVDVSQQNNSTDNTAIIGQISGNDLKVELQQSHGANRNLTKTTQYGTNNLISIEQVASSDNGVFINQGSASTTSSDNRARVYQKDGSQEGEITINQNVTTDGSANYAQVEQAFPSGTSTGNEATINQEGSRNVTRLGQTGTGNHMAMISQTGNNNLVQGPGTSTYETGPMATQTGDGNTMTVTQTSPDGLNTAIFNTANLSQSGMTNTLNLSQTANSVNNISTISQAGTGNMTTVTQVGNGAMILPGI